MLQNNTITANGLYFITVQQMRLFQFITFL